MSRFEGVVVGLVKSVDDPQGEGRVQVEFPWLGGNNQGYWAPIATIMSGGGRGTWFMPEPQDEVLVAFDHGDLNHPFIIGFLWNGRDRPPITDPKRRLIRSVNGHEIEIYDPGIADGDAGYIRLKDAHGNRIELANALISITGVAAINIQAPNVIINGRLVLAAPSGI